MTDIFGRRRNLWLLAMFVAVSLGGGTTIWHTYGPDAWYATLAKPAFNPPNWVFGPVWSSPPHS